MRARLPAFLLVLAICVVSARSQEASVAERAESPELRLTVDLIDGSRIVGVPGTNAIRFVSSLGAFTVPFTKIKSLTFRDDHEGLLLALTNGDHLVGTHDIGKLRMKTLMGDVAVDAAFVRRIAVAQSRNGAFVREGLVLWNRLDSEEDVAQSVVGPGGRRTGGRFVEGRFGKGLELSMQEPFGVTFPVEALTTSAGCLEFWAELNGFPSELPTGASPGLIGWAPPGQDDGFVLFFSANDGNANGGLCVRSSFGYLGTGSYGSWTYANAIGGGKIGDWHHYAMVWDNGGIRGVADGTRRVATFVDGKLNASHGSFGTGDRFLDVPPASRLGLLNHQGLVNGRIVFDNLKIWNYAKTDFSDRNED